MSTPNGTGEDGTDLDAAAVVFDLDPACTLEDIEAGNRYHATVNGVVDYGVFVDLSENVSGLVHESNLVGAYGVGDELIVELDDVRENGDVSFVEVQVAEYDTRAVGPGPRANRGDLEDLAGDRVHLEGQVVQINQTGGPTVFQVRLTDGVVPCAAFEEAGVRAYPEIDLDDVVRIVGTVESREGYYQIEVDNIEVLSGDARDEVAEQLFESVATAVQPESVDPLVEWPAFEKLWDDLASVAKRLRETVLAGRPIRIRHHADGDGLCASVTWSTRWSGTSSRPGRTRRRRDT
jgi:RecJ-like exonuclease